MDHCLFQRLFSFDYVNYDCRRVKSISFIWLDEILYDSEGEFSQIIKPYEWNFFNNISECILFIEKQIRQQHYIFLIVSGTFGQELFLTTHCLMQQVFAKYVYCAHLGPHSKWTKEYSQIRGVYNDFVKLAQHIKRDYNQLKNSLEINSTNTYNKSIIDQQNKVRLNIWRFNKRFFPQKFSNKIFIFKAQIIIYIHIKLIPVDFEILKAIITIENLENQRAEEYLNSLFRIRVQLGSKNE